jgi:hypothetical protein
MQENICVRRILLVCTIPLALEISILPALGQGSLFCPGGFFTGGSGAGVCGNPKGESLGNAF